MLWQFHVSHFPDQSEYNNFIYEIIEQEINATYILKLLQKYNSSRNQCTQLPK